MICALDELYYKIFYWLMVVGTPSLDKPERLDLQCGEILGILTPAAYFEDLERWSALETRVAVQEVVGKLHPTPKGAAPSGKKCICNI